MPPGTLSALNYYALLGLSNGATVPEIRRAYRELSKRYHPDTSPLPPDEAREKFQQLKDAYTTLSNDRERHLYDVKLRLERDGIGGNGVQLPPHWKRTPEAVYERSPGMGREPSERPLSGGELFVLLILGITLMGCLLLAIAIGLTRENVALSSQTPELFSMPVSTIASDGRMNLSDPSWMLNS
ncbi:J domain-containing protein [Laspinema sp. D2d]|uniref:J domain-containing protein n=1 Tax=Laspinema sp. D2d TaxID=2953686 RepID=UPI0021BB2D7D|nr:J domain-containing protein [Laspinema sp. D2d]